MEPLRILNLLTDARVGCRYYGNGERIEGSHLNVNSSTCIAYVSVQSVRGAQCILGATRTVVSCFYRVIYCCALNL